jgi:hypothetical protein
MSKSQFLHQRDQILAAATRDHPAILHTRDHRNEMDRETDDQ